jgi:ribosome-binding protein aMBF1 (putative translation factor)
VRRNLLHILPIAPWAEDVRRMVGRNVRRLRIAAGLSQAALAERMGVDRSYISGLELGSAIRPSSRSGMSPKLSV